MESSLGNAALCAFAGAYGYPGCGGVGLGVGPGTRVVGVSWGDDQLRDSAKRIEKTLPGAAID